MKTISKSVMGVAVANVVLMGTLMVAAIGCGAAPDDGSPSDGDTSEHVASAAQADSSWYSCIRGNSVYCSEQQGTYAGVCATNGGSVALFPGQGCSSVCDVQTDCEGGCFTNYLTDKSINYLASTYACVIPAPTATELSFTVDGSGTFITFNATLSNGHMSGTSAESDASVYFLYNSPVPSGWGSFPIGNANSVDTNIISLSGAIPGWNYFQLCVQPAVEGMSAGNATSVTGTTVCTSWVNKNDAVSASGMKLTISGDQATGSYTYSDADGLAESGSVPLVYRADNSSGSNAKLISSTSSTWTLTPADADQYLIFCVMPSNGAMYGSKNCSAVTKVGHLLELYKDEGLSGTNVNLAYKWSAAGTCFNLSDYGLDNALTSFMTTSAVTLTMYQGSGCTGTSATLPLTAGGDYDLTGGSWNDSISSVSVTW